MGQPALIDVRYFYYRDDRRQPLITLCRVMTADGVMAFAWAICSPTDSPHKNDEVFLTPDTRREWTEPGGKTLARGRALRALRTGTAVNDTVRVYARPIHRPEALDVITDCKAYALLSLSGNGRFDNLPKSMQPPGEGDTRASA